MGACLRASESRALEQAMKRDDRRCLTMPVGSQAGSLLQSDQRVAIQRVCTSLCACAIALLGVSCGRDDPSTDARPVRTLTVARSDEGEPITLTGELRPAIQVNIAFRLSGRLLE